MANGHSDINIQLTRLEAVTTLRLLLEEHFRICHDQDPVNQVRCKVIESVIERLWGPTSSPE